jgi:hypothetical protein
MFTQKSLIGSFSESHVANHFGKLCDKRETFRVLFELIKNCPWLVAAVIVIIDVL